MGQGGEAEGRRAREAGEEECLKEGSVMDRELSGRKRRWDKRRVWLR